MSTSKATTTKDSSTPSTSQLKPTSSTPASASQQRHSSASPQSSQPPPQLSQAALDAQRQKIVEGFKINSMVMRNADTGEIVWQSTDWDKAFEEELRIEIPASILTLKAVSREMNFSSVEEIANFRLVQSVTLHGQPLEQWKFHFGFVIPGSTNTWQCVIESAGEENMIPASVLSGHIVIETHFYDGERHVETTKQRVYYV